MRAEVAVVHDGSVALHGAADALASCDQWDFRHDVTSLDDVLMLPLGPPCVVVLDPFSGGAPLGDVVRAGVNVRVLVLSARISVDNARLAIRHGARGVLGKHADVTTLLAAVGAVGVGGLYFDSNLDDALLRPDSSGESSAAAAENLTPREREVLGMVARGFTHKQIGARLHLSKATVDTYVHRVRQKTGSVNKAGLTRVAMGLDLLNDAV